MEDTVTLRDQLAMLDDSFDGSEPEEEHDRDSDGDGEPTAQRRRAPARPARAGAAAPAAVEAEPDAETLEDLYFREMGSIPLAKREGELRLAAGIEQAREALTPYFERPPAVVPRVLGAGFTKPRGRSMEETLPERVGDAIVTDVGAVLAAGTHDGRKLPRRSLDALARYRDGLVAALRGIDDAKALLTEANLRLVIHIAKRYRRHQIPMLDLVQEGNIGLMKAVERFRADTGFRFSTYASWWIHQYIRRSIDNQAGLVRIPLYLQEEKRKIARTSHDLGLELGRKPRIEEIAERAGIEKEAVEERLTMRSEAISLDTPLSEDSNQDLGDMLADSETPNPFERTADGELSERVKEALEVLTPREQKILRLRFGVDEISAHSLQEISVRFHLTRERIRQIEAQALKTLRAAFEEKDLAGAA